jgi:hypothetical protein
VVFLSTVTVTGCQLQTEKFENLKKFETVEQPNCFKYTHFEKHSDIAQSRSSQPGLESIPLDPEYPRCTHYSSVSHLETCCCYQLFRCGLVVLEFKQHLLYLIIASKHKSSNAGNSGISERRCKF